MKNIILGSISLVFGVCIFLWLWKDSALKSGSGGRWIYALKGYFGAVGAIILGLTMIFREIFK
jgi:hypothetical protein